MEERIYKYPIKITDHQVIKMPNRAYILCVQVVQGQACVYARVNASKDAELVERKIRMYGTGHTCDETKEGCYMEGYIGTVQLNDGKLVFHLFEQE